jgi:hypothetical protein
MTGIENPVQGQDKWFKARTPRTRTTIRTETGSEQGPENDGLDQGQDSQDQDNHQNRDRIRTRTRKWWSGSRPELPGPRQSPEQRQDQNKDQKMMAWIKARTRMRIRKYQDDRNGIKTDDKIDCYKTRITLKTKTRTRNPRTRTCTRKQDQD